MVWTALSIAYSVLPSTPRTPIPFPTYPLVPPAVSRRCPTLTFALDHPAALVPLLWELVTPFWRRNHWTPVYKAAKNHRECQRATKGHIIEMSTHSLLPSQEQLPELQVLNSSFLLFMIFFCVLLSVTPHGCSYHSQKFRGEALSSCSSSSVRTGSKSLFLPELNTQTINITVLMDNPGSVQLGSYFCRFAIG